MKGSTIISHAILSLVVLQCLFFGSMAQPGGNGTVSGPGDNGPDDNGPDAVDGPDDDGPDLNATMTKTKAPTMMDGATPMPAATPAPDDKEDKDDDDETDKKDDGEVTTPPAATPLVGGTTAAPTTAPTIPSKDKDEDDDEDDMPTAAPAANSTVMNATTTTAPVAAVTTVVAPRTPRPSLMPVKKLPTVTASGSSSSAITGTNSAVPPLWVVIGTTLIVVAVTIQTVGLEF